MQRTPLARTILSRIGLATGGVLVARLLAEAAFRVAIAASLPFFRSPDTYADSLSDDYCKLRALGSEPEGRWNTNAIDPTSSTIRRSSWGRSRGVSIARCCPFAACPSRASSWKRVGSGWWASGSTPIASATRGCTGLAGELSRAGWREEFLRTELRDLGVPFLDTKQILLEAGIPRQQPDTVRSPE